VIRPAAPHRTPLITRSDGISFHLFVEESYVTCLSSKLEVVALFRYDLDPAAVRAESALAHIPLRGDDETEVLEQAADTLAIFSLEVFRWTTSMAERFPQGRNARMRLGSLKTSI